MIEYKQNDFLSDTGFFYSIQLADGGRCRCHYNLLSEAPELARHIMPASRSSGNPWNIRQHLYYIIVPEQFTMQTQRNVVENASGKGILNIDVLSFERLAYRIFEEVGGAREVLLDDTGKSMVLHKLVQQHQKICLILEAR